MGGIRSQRAIPTESGMVAREEVPPLALQRSCGVGAEHVRREDATRETRSERGVRLQHSEKGAVSDENGQWVDGKSARFLFAAAISATSLVAGLQMQLAPNTTEVPLARRAWWTSGELPCQGDTQSAWPRNVTDAA